MLGGKPGIPDGGPNRCWTELSLEVEDEKWTCLWTKAEASSWRAACAFINGSDLVNNALGLVVSKGCEEMRGSRNNNAETNKHNNL